MAKKEPIKSDAPVVTSLPLPSSDSVLVIDLPDGQKLLVGKMAPGSVIEVATWRGTGRPDSRTNRLMLGMSNGENPEPETSPDREEVDKFSLQYVLFLFRNVPALIAFAVGRIKNLAVKLRGKKVEAINKSASDIEVEEWLNRLTDKVSESVTSPEKIAPKIKKTTKSASNSAQKRKSSTNKPRKKA